MSKTYVILWQVNHPKPNSALGGEPGQRVLYERVCNAPYAFCSAQSVLRPLRDASNIVRLHGLSDVQEACRKHWTFAGREGDCERECDKYARSIYNVLAAQSVEAAQGEKIEKLQEKLAQAEAACEQAEIAAEEDPGKLTLQTKLTKANTKVEKCKEDLQKARENAKADEAVDLDSEMDRYIRECISRGESVDPGKLLELRDKHFQVWGGIQFERAGTREAQKRSKIKASPAYQVWGDVVRTNDAGSTPDTPQSTPTWKLTDTSYFVAVIFSEDSASKIVSDWLASGEAQMTHACATRREIGMGSKVVKVGVTNNAFVSHAMLRARLGKCTKHVEVVQEFKKYVEELDRNVKGLEPNLPWEA